jgi:hypothetical protein
LNSTSMRPNVRIASSTSALNTAQQVAGSIGTSLLNTLAASAATSYLVGRTQTPANLQAALLHSYTTAFLWSSSIFVAGAIVAGLVLQRGGLTELAFEDRAEKVDPEIEEQPRIRPCRVWIACR